MASAISGSLANFSRSNRSVPSVGREYIQASSPSANMFFARSASFLPMPSGSSAAAVSEVIATGCTVYGSSESSSSGSSA